MEKIPNRPTLPDLRKLQAQFEEKYHRKMTTEELRVVRAIEKLLQNPPEEDGNKK